MVLQNVSLLLVSVVALVLSGFLLVKSLSKIAQFLRITEFSAAFIIMSIATSIPELFVGISSGLIGRSALSLGNVIGANIIDLTLIMGILIVLGKGISTRQRELKESPYIITGIAALPLLLFYIGNTLSRIDGVLLILVFSLYSWRMVKGSQRFEKRYKAFRAMKDWQAIFTTLIFAGSLLLLFVSSNYVIKYSSLIATELNFPDIFLGLFLISFATTLPELIFGVSAIFSGHKSMSVGDQVGTIITNSTLVLGVVSLISPISADFMLFVISALFLLFSVFLFATFAASGRRLDKTEGIALIMFYIVFLFMQIYITRLGTG